MTQAFTMYWGHKPCDSVTNREDFLFFLRAQGGPTFVGLRRGRRVADQTEHENEDDDEDDRFGEPTPCPSQEGNRRGRPGFERKKRSIFSG